jgi:hypothetical protein
MIRLLLQPPQHAYIIGRTQDTIAYLHLHHDDQDNRTYLAVNMEILQTMLGPHFQICHHPPPNANVVERRQYNNENNRIICYLRDDISFQNRTVYVEIREHDLERLDFTRGRVHNFPPQI